MSVGDVVVRSYLDRSFAVHLARALRTGLLDRHPDLTEAEGAAILWFTSDRSKELLARFHAGTVTPVDLAFVSVLEAAIEKLPYCREEYVDRVINVPTSELPAFLAKYRVGEIIRWPAPTSCSATHAFRGRGNVIFIIRQRTGRVVGPFSWYPHENEIVILGGHEYVVTSVDDRVASRIVVGLDEQPVEE